MTTRISFHLLALFVFAVIGTAHAETEIIPDDPGCVGKFRGEICQLYDGTNSGGLCVPSRCGKGDRPCLKCQPVSPETRATDGDLWVPMLSFGIIVTIIGGIFWLRLKRNWDSK